MKACKTYTRVAGIPMQNSIYMKKQENYTKKCRNAEIIYAEAQTNTHVARRWADSRTFKELCAIRACKANTKTVQL